MFSKILEHKITLIVGVVLCAGVLITAGYFLLSPQKRVLNDATSQIMTIRETVSADGDIDSDQHVSLSFQQTGQVTAVNVKVGDQVYAGETLATIDSGTLYASLQGAKADVLSAQANLESVQLGSTPQTLTLSGQGVSTAQSSLSTATHDAYLKVQDAIVNLTSPLFQNGTSANPTLSIPSDSYQTSLSLADARASLTGELSAWDSLLTASPTGDQTLAKAASTIADAKSFMDGLSAAANRLNINNSGLVQSSIDTDVAAVNAAASEVNAAETEFDSAIQTYNTAVDQFGVVQASSTPQNLQMAQAGLAKAQANVASIQSQIDNTILTAPFNGIVASVNPKVGDNFAADTPAIDVISSGAYKIDIMVPENEVAAISVGDPATVQLDGSDLEASGTVSSIDLSETVTDGVGAYKTTVYLNGSDPNIRTGMGATVTIEGASAENVVAVPSSAIISTNGGSYVLVKDAQGNYDQQSVETGISDGTWTEIRSGLDASTTIAAFGQ